MQIRRRTAVGLFLFFAAASRVDAGVISLAEITDAASFVYSTQTDGPNPTATSANASFDLSGSSTSLNASAWAGQVFGPGVGYVAFKLKSSALVSQINTSSYRATSRIIWDDVLLSSPGQSGPATLQFAIDGIVEIQQSATGTTPEQWDLSISDGTNSMTAEGVYDNINFGTKFQNVAGWTSFTPFGLGNFKGTFEIPVQFDVPFTVEFDSQIFAQDIETLVSADLGNTITLTSVLGSGSSPLSTASFGSGLSFSSGAAAVPEPGMVPISLAALGVMGVIQIARRRARRHAASRDAGVA